MSFDETLSLPGTAPQTPEEVFQVGDRTIFQLRKQTFELGEEFGTMVVRPHHADEQPEAVAAPASAMTLEQKVDTLLNAVAALQRRLDSIDAVIAKIATR